MKIYRSLAETSEDMIFVINVEDRVESLNKRAADSLQKLHKEVIGTARGSFFFSDVNQRQKDFLDRVFCPASRPE